MAHEDFVTYEQARTLKDLGFNWECDHTYRVYGSEPILRTHVSYFNYNDIYKEVYSAPTMSLVQKWLREIHGIDVDIDSIYYRLNTGDKIMYSSHIGIQKIFRKEFYLNYDSHNEALSEGIDHALKIIKNKSR